LTSKGAAVNGASFSEFDDCNDLNPKLLAILSSVKLPDGSEALSMANRECIFVKRQ